MQIILSLDKFASFFEDGEIFKQEQILILHDRNVAR